MPIGQELLIRQWFRTLACLFGLAMGLSWANAELPRPMEILVPAYFYPTPGSPWNQLNLAAARVPLTAIMNPNSGPGSNVDPNYVGVVSSLRSAGGKVIAYVSSSYAARPIANVLSDIDRYREWYSIDGFFIDEMSNLSSQTALNYYSQIYAYIKNIKPTWEVIGNPGTNTLEAYLTRPTADRLVVFEEAGVHYANYVPSDWNANYGSNRFVHLLHTEPSVAAMRNQIQWARQRNSSMIYITNDVLVNPWDQLPSYWANELSEVESINRTLQGDLNSDGQTNCQDIDLLTAVIAGGGNGAQFDLDGDGQVTTVDRDVWLMVAGNRLLGAGRSFLPGDANLDGVVDGTDFGIWNSNKFTNVAAWCGGDFTADGVVDGSDFGIWNSRKFTASDGSLVPEVLPSALVWSVVIPVLLRSLQLIS
jgi:Spherulation-specific family 4